MVLAGGVPGDKAGDAGPGGEQTQSVPDADAVEAGLVDGCDKKSHRIIRVRRRIVRLDTEPQLLARGRLVQSRE